MKQLSIKEKVAICKKSTSKKQIKKLALLHGITTKSIKNWLIMFEKGELKPEKNKKNSKRAIKEDAKKVRPFKDIIFKVQKIDPPFRSNGKNGLYRFLVRDMNYGFTLSAYSRNNETGTACAIFEYIIENLSIAGYKVKNVNTDKTVQGNEHKKCFKNSEIKHNVVSNKELVKYLIFAISKDNYIKSRDPYESDADFLFDALATIGKINARLYLSGTNKQKVINIVSECNIFLHSKIQNNGKLDFNCDVVINLLKNKNNDAMKFHKAVDYANADLLYEKLNYIIEPAVNSEDYLKEALTDILYNRGRIYGLKRNFEASDRFFKNAIQVAKMLEVTKKNKHLQAIYSSLSEKYRIENNKKQSLYYMNKVKKIVYSHESQRPKALFHLNYGLLLQNYKNYREAFKNFKISENIINEKNIDDLKTHLDNAIAGNYNSTGRFDEAIEVFKKMINKGVYSDKPYYEALLYAKNADALQMTGRLSESISYYDKGIKILDKHIETKLYFQLQVIIYLNKGNALAKMNRFSEAVDNFRKCFENTKRLNMGTAIISSISNLINSEIDLMDLKSAKKDMKEYNLLIKNVNDPAMKYGYYLFEGLIFEAENKYDKAERSIIQAADIAMNINDKNQNFNKCNLYLIDLYIKTGEFAKADKRLKTINYTVKKSKTDSLYFKFKMQKRKLSFFITGNKEKYYDFLQNLHNNPEINEEQQYLIAKELQE